MGLRTLIDMRCARLGISLGATLVLASLAGCSESGATGRAPTDSDGDNDFAAGSHWLGGNDNARLAWFQNMDGKGLSWTMHSLSEDGLSRTA